MSRSHWASRMHFKWACTAATTCAAAVTTHEYPLAHAQQALKDLKAGRFDGAAVLTS
jgi:hypothetical protein